MTREEFNERVTQPVFPAEYKIIDFVYNFHPAISNTNGKNQIVMIYEYGGMRVIRDMLPTAQEAEKIASEIQRTQNRLDELKRSYEKLKE